MPRRQLNYLARLALERDWPMALESFVLHLEQYAGQHDTGIHQIERLNGTPALSWTYTPVHLWQMPAETLLSLGKSGIIPLIGLTQIQQPKTILNEAVTRLQAEPDEARRHTLLANLMALMSDEEHLKMLEQLIETDEFELDTPYLRRQRKQIQEAGAKARRDDVLEVVTIRFNPPIQLYREIEDELAQIEDPQHLQDLLAAAVKAMSVEAFMQVVIASKPSANGK